MKAGVMGLKAFLTGEREQKCRVEFAVWASLLCLDLHASILNIPHGYQQEQVSNTL